LDSGFWIEDDVECWVLNVGLGRVLNFGWWIAPKALWRVAGSEWRKRVGQILDF
jgi:hypothetical protein